MMLYHMIYDDHYEYIDETLLIAMIETALDPEWY